MSLNIVEEERGDWVVLRASGEMDVMSSPAVRQHVHDAVAGGRRSVVLDLSDVLFCDSSGVGVLIASRRLMHACTGRFRIILPAKGAEEGSHVNRVLSALGVRRLFECYPDLNAATGSASVAAAARLTA